MKNKKQANIFGPVPSRRLGRSLGVDLAPFKTCSYDCVYCQLGRTTTLTTSFHEHPLPEIIINELKQKLQQTKPDFVTLSGSGEPTLYAHLAKLMGDIKQITTVPLALLTNGSMLWDRNVQDAAIRADLVAPSLDAGDASLFQNINRPHPGISFELMLEGLIEFGRRFRGKLWLEIFLLRGVTALPSEARKISALSERINPDKIQLNTVTRPPAESFAYAVPSEQMKRLSGLFPQGAEVITDYAVSEAVEHSMLDSDDILNMLRRRPCTLADVASGLHLHPTQAAKALQDLLSSGKIIEQREQKKVFFQVPQEKFQQTKIPLQTS